jgi:hypothetical protein
MSEMFEPIIGYIIIVIILLLYKYFTDDKK